ncbi:MAG TPA: DUF58 domain-containing protein [Polyangiaceae bacterium]|nr:DUF58 domain-containing protein [Polyangiaceae bacterium]
MDEKRSVRTSIDWGELSPLRVRAREVAEGVYSGLHRSALRGSGVEFGGYREYVPGDDLRWLDRRSLLRHDRLVVRQFETETDRALCLLLDASASMGYRSPRAPGAKIAFGAVVVAALARVALAQGDPVGLSFVAGAHAVPVSRANGREQFERIVAALESVEVSGDATLDPSMLERAIHAAARGARRGTIFVLVSDLIDWPSSEIARVAAMTSGGRVLGVVRTLDPSETTFPFEGTVRLRALEGRDLVETDARASRDHYLGVLAALTQEWKDGIVSRGGRFLTARTDDPPVEVVRDLIRSIR